MLASEITQSHEENIVNLSKGIVAPSIQSQFYVINFSKFNIQSISTLFIENLFKVSDHLLMAIQSKAGNDYSKRFADSIKRLVESEKLQRGYELSPSAVANRIYAQLMGAIHNHNEVYLNSLFFKTADNN